jgi:hypothetical protein
VQKASELALRDVPSFGLRRKSEADILFEELVGGPSASSEATRPSGMSENIPNSSEPLSTNHLGGLFSSTMYLNLSYVSNSNLQIPPNSGEDTSTIRADRYGNATFITKGGRI